MFGSKRCSNCGKELKRDWVVCPYCGEEVEKRPYARPFDIFEDVEKEFERIDKIFGPRFFKFPRIDIRAPLRSGGISITIKSGTGMEPKIDVKTSGEYKKLEPEIKRKLGLKEKIEEVEEKQERKPPKITEEPETKIERKGEFETISIKLPDVKSPEDIEVRKLEQSLEVKAFVGDKAYFKLIPIKPNSTILNKSFKNGTLIIDLQG